MSPSSSHRSPACIVDSYGVILSTEIKRTMRFSWYSCAHLLLHTLRALAIQITPVRFNFGNGITYGMEYLKSGGCTAKSANIAMRWKGMIS